MNDPIPREPGEADLDQLRLRAERALLSYELAGHRLEPRHDRERFFRAEPHRRIQAAIDGIVARGGTPDRETVRLALASDPCADEANAVLERLLDCPFDAESAAEHARPFQYLVRLAANVAKREGGQVELVSAAGIEPRSIDWLWDGWLARGKLHLLAGNVGAGKTTLALSLAAAITAGGRLPDGSQAEPGHVLYWSGEDDPADTLIPRLVAAGGLREKLAFVRGVTDAEGRFDALDPARDLKALARAMHRLADLKLLIVDPIASVLAGNGDKNAAGRLGALMALAAARNVAILGIAHFARNNYAREPLDRIAGSLPVVAAARLIMTTGRAACGRPLITRAKSNIGPDGDGFFYALEPASSAPGITAPRIAWGEPASGMAGDLLAPASRERVDAPQRALAEEWLAVRLERPALARDVESDARAAGLAWRTVERAKKKLGVVSTQQAPRTWLWRLPPPSQAAT